MMMKKNERSTSINKSLSSDIFTVSCVAAIRWQNQHPSGDITDHHLRPDSTDECRVYVDVFPLLEEL